jgi:hypothetical protein
MVTERAAFRSEIESRIALRDERLDGRDPLALGAKRRSRRAPQITGSFPGSFPGPWRVRTCLLPTGVDGVTHLMDVVPFFGTFARTRFRTLY